MTTNGVPVPPERARAARAVAGVLQPGTRVALTTHVNADGDGVGSEVALWHLLTQRGLGDLQRAIKHSHAVACIDHHVSRGSLPEGPRLVAPDAAATAELVFDFASAEGWPLGPEAARALYVGILTDTGAFRFPTTTPRGPRTAGALLGR